MEHIWWSSKAKQCTLCLKHRRRIEFDCMFHIHNDSFIMLFSQGYLENAVCVNKLGISAWKSNANQIYLMPRHSHTNIELYNCSEGMFTKKFYLYWWCSQTVAVYLTCFLEIQYKIMEQLIKWNIIQTKTLTRTIFSS